MKKIITVSYSEISTARQCGLKHHLQYMERWSRQASGARSLGTRWHAVLASHYNAIRTIQKNQFNPGKGNNWNYSLQDNLFIRSEVAKEFANHPNDVANETLIWMYSEHIKEYGYQPHWTIKGVEKEVTVPLPEIEGSDIQFKLKVIIDLIVNDPFGHLYVIDHKTSQNMMSESYMGFMDQFGLYDWVLNQCGFKVYANILQFQKTTKYKKKTPEQKYACQFKMDRTDIELDNIALDAVRTAYQTYTWPHNLLGEPPSHPNPEMCQRMCDFREAHLSQRKGLTTITEYLDGTGFAQDHIMVDPQFRDED